MYVAQLPASVRRSLRRSKYQSDRWLTIVWTRLSSGISSKLSSGISSKISAGIGPRLPQIAWVPVVLPIAALATPIAATTSIDNASSIYNAERRLQLAYAINDRSSIARIHAELDRLF
jgi:hypothetical protein